MKELIANQGGVIALVLAVLMAYNVLMTAVKTVLEMFKVESENQFYQFIQKSLKLAVVAIDWLSGNKEHK